MELRERVARMTADTAGRLYDANFDPDVLAALRECADLCWEYNRLRPGDVEGRAALLDRILGGHGEQASVTQPFWCDYGRNVRVGERFYANHGLQLLDGAPITFGDDVFIGPNCVFSTAGHPLDAGLRNRGLEYALPIAVGDSVWFGMGVLVCPGVTIGSGTVIGAGSVVTRDVPSGVVAVGSPCRPIREITEADAATHELYLPSPGSQR